jgi:hypothetical protein
MWLFTHQLPQRSLRFCNQTIGTRMLLWSIVNDLHSSCYIMVWHWRIGLLWQFSIAHCAVYQLTGLSGTCVEQCKCCWFSGYGYRSNLGGFWHWCFIWRSTAVHLWGESWFYLIHPWFLCELRAVTEGDVVHLHLLLSVQELSSFLELLKTAP